MLESLDLTDRHDVERLRRSVAMLPAGSWVFRREDALKMLEQLQRGDAVK